jgi:small subunit ribosomal protein S6
MNNYETLYIVAADTEETTRENLIKKFETVVTSKGGTVEKTDKWGSKKLAYPIDFKTEGFYVLMTFSGGNTIPAELERNMRIADEIVRFIVIRKDA